MVDNVVMVDRRVVIMKVADEGVVMADEGVVIVVDLRVEGVEED